MTLEIRVTREIRAPPMLSTPARQARPVIREIRGSSEFGEIGAIVVRP
jgi:hypothetical protein